MKSRKVGGVVLHAEYKRIPGKRGLLSSYPDAWITHIIAKFHGHHLILEEKWHDNAADARARYNHLRNAIGVS